MTNNILLYLVLFQVIAVLCSVGGVVLVAVFSEKYGAQDNSTSSSNSTNNSSGSQIHETPQGYVVSGVAILLEEINQ